MMCLQAKAKPKKLQRKKQEDGANSASGSKENDAAWQELSAQKQGEREREREREREIEDP